MSTERVLPGIAREAPRFELPHGLFYRLQDAIEKPLTHDEFRDVANDLRRFVGIRAFILASPRGCEDLPARLEPAHNQAVAMLAALNDLRKDEQAFGLVERAYHRYKWDSEQRIIDLYHALYALRDAVAWAIKDLPPPYKGHPESKGADMFCAIFMPSYERLTGREARLSRSASSGKLSGPLIRFLVTLNEALPVEMQSKSETLAHHVKMRRRQQNS